jgi:hypothetical protein
MGNFFRKRNFSGGMGVQQSALWKDWPADLISLNLLQWFTKESLALRVRKWTIA